jgi:DNA replication and repair protein RecF
MILDQLTLQQFRSYSKTSFSFSPKTTLIVGVNTAGKTNILEAIYLLATGKSFRADSDREIIRWNEEVTRIKAVGNETKLEILLTQGVVSGAKAPLKKYLVNGVARRMIDFIGNLRAVLFWPEHLELITDSPSVRRKYLDSVLIQVDREYRRNLISYERGLRQRNRLLDLINEGKAHRHQLLFWDQLLIKSGSYITDTRAAYIDFVNNYTLTDLQKNKLLYDKSVISEARLDQYAMEEVSAKATLVGPHRDDIEFMIADDRMPSKDENLRDLSKYGSRGEQRLAILWLKLAEVAFVEEKTGERPILLLDDIFSELDEQHREFVLGIIGKQQTIITTAEEEVLSMLKHEKISMNLIHLTSRKTE